MTVAIDDEEMSMSKPIDEYQQRPDDALPVPQPPVTVPAAAIALPS